MYFRAIFVAIFIALTLEAAVAQNQIELKILTWNVECEASSLARIRHEMARLPEPDIWVFQEARGEWIAPLLETAGNMRGEGDRYSYILSRSGPKCKKLLIMYDQERLSITKGDPIEISVPVFDHTSTPPVLARFFDKQSNLEFWLLACDLDEGDDWKRVRIRKKQASFIRKYVRVHCYRNPVVVAGDFCLNLRVPAPARGRNDLLREFEKDSNLAWVPPTGSRNWWNSRVKLNVPSQGRCVVGQSVGTYLQDAFFVSSWNWTGWEIASKVFGSVGFCEEADTSDHRPLLAWLKFPRH